MVSTWLGFFVVLFLFLRKERSVRLGALRVLRARELVREGRIGTLRAVQAFFAYDNPDPANIRNRAEIGGGGLTNEKAYQLLVDQGEQDRLDRYLYGKAEETLAKTVLKGPGTSTQAVIDAFNEVCGA